MSSEKKDRTFGSEIIIEAIRNELFYPESALLTKFKLTTTNDKIFL